MEFINKYDKLLTIVVSGVSVYILWKQIHEQSKFSQRIADLEYIKLMEPKLLAVVYDYENIISLPYIHHNALNENSSSLPPFDWYKFHFLSGKIRNGVDSYAKLSEWTITNPDKYIKTYEETIKHIKTKDLRDAFKNSRWAEFYELCKKQ